MESTDCVGASSTCEKCQLPSVHEATEIAKEAKVAQVLRFCNPDTALHELQELAGSRDGFVRDDVRRQAWSRLLNLASLETETAIVHNSWRTRPPHKDEDQVSLDVHRSFVYYPTTRTESQLEQWQEQLHDLIIQVLRSFPQLNYFQGYHDIAQVMLLVLGQQMAPKALASLSLLRLRDFMLPQLSSSITQLDLLPAIIRKVDQRLFMHLSGTRPFFALSATLTMYAHEIQEYGDIARLFDFLIASPAVIPLYLFAVTVLLRSEELFEIPRNEPEMLHAVLSKLPKPLDLESLITRTRLIFVQHPPETLGWAWWRIPSSSTLKTTLQQQPRTIQYGEEMFARQIDQQRRQERWRRTLITLQGYRKPAARLGLAFAVMALSYWLARKGYRL